MPRKYDRAIASSYQTEDKKKPDAVQLGNELAEDDFTGYDPLAYYQRATDYNGHSKNIQVNIPTTFSAAVQKVVDSASNPYRSATDMARDFVVHGLVRTLKAMSEQGEEVPTFWFAQVQLEHYKWEIEGQIKYLDGLEEDAELFLKAGDFDTLHRCLYDAEQLELAGTLRRRRDEIARKYRAMIPENYHVSWEV
jgi:hypothetical protein